MATYKQIESYVKQHYGYKPKGCWIAHAKEIYGLPVKMSHRRYSPDKREKPCPEHRLPHIKAAFQHFGML